MHDISEKLFCNSCQFISKVNPRKTPTLREPEFNKLRAIALFRASLCAVVSKIV